MIAEISVNVFRFDPSSDNAPRYDSYTIPYTEKMRVLDALERIRCELKVSDIAYRWFCGSKKCGTCGLTLNGRPSLSCWEAAQDKMVLEPLANFPILRDLVIDIDGYEKLVLDLYPFMKRSGPVPKFPERISHDRMEQTDLLQSCFECYLCSSAVSVAGISSDGPIWDTHGPAALTKFARFSLDPRDGIDRAQLADKSGLARFPLDPVLSSVCPQGIDLLQDAILPLRRKFGIENSAPAAVTSKAVFIKAKTWSAFVRLPLTTLESMRTDGKLTSIPGREAQFVFSA